MAYKNIEQRRIAVKKAMRQFIIKRDNGICKYCGGTPDNPIVEHVIPAAKGGLATKDNLVTACQSCNMKKRYRDNV